MYKGKRVRRNKNSQREKNLKGNRKQTKRRVKLIIKRNVEKDTKGEKKEKEIFK